MVLASNVAGSKEVGDRHQVRTPQSEVRHSQNRLGPWLGERFGQWQLLPAAEATRCNSLDCSLGYMGYLLATLYATWL